MKNLKICPFCGGDAGIKSKKLEGISYVWIQCNTCRVATDFTLFKNMPARLDINHPSMKNVIDKWNNRI